MSKFDNKISIYEAFKRGGRFRTLGLFQIRKANKSKNIIDTATVQISNMFLLSASLRSCKGFWPSS